MLHPFLDQGCQHIGAARGTAGQEHHPGAHAAYDASEQGWQQDVISHVRAFGQDIEGNGKHHGCKQGALDEFPSHDKQARRKQRDIEKGIGQPQRHGPQLLGNDCQAGHAPCYHADRVVYIFNCKSDKECPCHNKDIIHCRASPVHIHISFSTLKCIYKPCPDLGTAPCRPCVPVVSLYPAPAHPGT